LPAASVGLPLPDRSVFDGRGQKGLFHVWLGGLACDISVVLLAAGECPGALPVLAVAKEDAGCGEEEERGRDDQHDPEAGEDADDLGAVPEDGGAGVTQTALALAGVVVTKKKVLI